jgi:hypothetical protein
MPGLERRYQSHPQAKGVDPKMREVLNTLCDIDFEHEVDLINLEQRDSDESFKAFFRGVLNAAHRQKRRPYAELLSELRRKQHIGIVQLEGGRASRRV